MLSRHKLPHRDLHHVRADVRLSVSSPHVSAPPLLPYPLHVVVGVGEVKGAVVGFLGFWAACSISIGRDLHHTWPTCPTTHPCNTAHSTLLPRIYKPQHTPDMQRLVALRRAVGAGALGAVRNNRPRYDECAASVIVALRSPCCSSHHALPHTPQSHHPLQAPVLRVER